MKTQTDKNTDSSSASVVSDSPNQSNETRAVKPHSRIAAMAKILGCSVSQINTQLDKNAKTLRAMHAQAVRTGKKVNGFRANDLDALAESYEKRTRA